MMPINFMPLKTGAGKFAVALLITLAAVGALIADTVTKQRDFDGQIKLSICGSDGRGGWVVKDTVTTGIRFGFSVTDVANGKTIRSDFVWSGRTAKGVSFRARLLGQGQASFNAANGAIEERLPLELELNGKKESFQLPLSTEQVKTAIGSLSGRRAQINGNVGQMALVGESFLKQVNPFEKQAGGQLAQPGKKAEPIAIVAEIRGRVIAKN
jgi:hypothetical protein